MSKESPHTRWGALMEQARDSRDMSQQAIADAMRTTQARISRWERGEHRISGPEFVTWAEKLTPPLSSNEWREFRELGMFSDDELDAQQRKHQESAA